VCLVSGGTGQEMLQDLIWFRYGIEDGLACCFAEQGGGEPRTPTVQPVCKERQLAVLANVHGAITRWDQLQAPGMNFCIAVDQICFPPFCKQNTPLQTELD
jgi:hypothetical protein